MVYTKKGDKGKTGLFGTKRRVSKASALIRAIGAVDEVNSYLGIAIARNRKQETVNSRIRKIQNDLFVIGAMLAGSNIKWNSERVDEFEKEIDKMEGELPVQTHFILPGGGELSAHLFYARTLVRRAERETVQIRSTKLEIRNVILPYLNRLSDYLFILARWVNFKSGKKEIFWKIASKSASKGVAF